jgi:GcrA cell cycle regulator
MHHDSPWTETTIGRLRNLWDEGLSAAGIARRLNVSKNAVIGKAHRLDLAERPSPIKYSDGQKRRQIRLPRAKRTPATALIVACVPRTSSAPVAGSETGTKMTAAQNMTEVTVTAATRSYRIAVCCWPIGDPGTSNFRFCDAPALPGKPYCAAHARLAYLKAPSSSDRKIA